MKLFSGISKQYANVHFTHTVIGTMGISIRAFPKRRLCVWPFCLPPFLACAGPQCRALSSLSLGTHHLPKIPCAPLLFNVMGFYKRHSEKSSQQPLSSSLPTRQHPLPNIFVLHHRLLPSSEMAPYSFHSPLTPASVNLSSGSFCAFSRTHGTPHVHEP